MTSFFSIEYYNPLMVFLIGFLSFVGLLGFGMMVSRFVRISFPAPWKQVAGILSGIQVVSVIIQILGMACLAYRPVLIGIWAIVILTGIVFFLKDARQFISTVSRPLKKSISFPFVVVVIALIVNLLVAIAPSTKIDELYYHMLLPSRMVYDSSLTFYRFPVESAVLPQMIFQISLSPLHALGFPDAGNVISWGLCLILSGFAWHLVRKNNRNRGWTYFWVAGLVTGMYPVIWYVTGGAHAMGDLATAAAVLALLNRRELCSKVPVKDFALMISFFVLCSVSTKLSLLPFGIILILLNLFFLFRQEQNTGKTWNILFRTLIPWIIFYLPVLLWTLWKSGSPFGPFLAGFLDLESIYNLDSIRQVIRETREINAPSLVTAIKSTFLDYSPLFAIALIGLAFIKAIPGTNRLILLILFTFQTILIVIFIFFDVRFYGGLMQGMLIYFASVCPEELCNRILNNKFKKLAIAVLLLFPWLTIQIYFAAQFLPVTFGIEKKNKFYSEKVAFFRDYFEIDKSIPKDAVLLFQGNVRLNAVYAPRPVFFDLQDMPADKKIYLFRVNVNTGLNEKLGNFKVGALVYRNDKAVTTIYRTPGRSPGTGELKVFSLEKTSNN